MLRWAAIFFVIAIIAAAFGAGNVEVLATKAAIVLFVIALILLLFGFIGRGGAGSGPPAV